MSNQPILVLGGTGRTGQHIVHQLVNQGESVRVLAREIERAREQLGDEPDLIAGDVTVPETIPAAFADVRWCICTIGSRAVESVQKPKDVDYQGIVNCIDAAQDAELDHFVLISSLGVTNENHPLNKYGNVLQWKLKSENHLRESGLEYTIIRPGGLADDVEADGLVFGQGDTISGMVRRVDVADVAIQALGNENAFGKTFELISGTDVMADDYDAIFASLQKG